MPKQLLILFTASAMVCSIASAEPKHGGKRIKSQCMAVAHLYAIARDQGDTAALKRLFTGDATLTLPSGTAVGIKQIADQFNATKSKRYAHHITTQHIRLLDQQRAEGTHYALVNTTLPVDGEEKQVLVSGVYDDKYTLQDDRCLIKSRKFTINFINH